MPITTVVQSAVRWATEHAERVEQTAIESAETIGIAIIPSINLDSMSETRAK